MVILTLRGQTLSGVKKSLRWARVKVPMNTLKRKLPSRQWIPLSSTLTTKTSCLWLTLTLNSVIKPLLLVKAKITPF
ncbi:hypothetical protein FA937_02805 [Mycoplasmoides pneumoniae]|nr:hypothetical protein FA925_02805 [Mycoplasmoides pneumoniae]QHR10562.1 hypothetical protein FA928_02805 [Mycoplasmoides pneumoniae]QHR13362.1 hypothetical protein FA932_02805 [Mycoplasmoides pneumoniae]QHR14761.1 hypothetical protein FA934_02805 [Mycoplasmoides pneumoniae]QHR16857.1 hypothetical protein FA937_02805 [Mycoplasmoides pneumoniae]